MPPARSRMLVSLAAAMLALAGALVLLAAPSAGARRAHRGAHSQVVGGLARGARAHAAIVGGQAASPGQFPSLAFVAYTLEPRNPNPNYTLCTGTVIAPTLVLTAAHCAEALVEEKNGELAAGAPYEPANYNVFTGAVNWYSGETEDSHVESVSVYPGFDAKELDGDAALLTLQEPVRAPAAALGNAAAMAALAANAPAEIVGWGVTEESADAKATTQLQWAETEVLSRAACEHALYFPEAFFHPENELCALGHSRSTGACHGDSGGPLLVEGATGLIEMGVTSHGYEEHPREACSTKIPTVFTRTDVLLPWIEDTERGIDFEPSPIEDGSTGGGTQPTTPVETPQPTIPVETPPTTPVQTPPTTPVVTPPTETTTAPTAAAAAPREGIYRGSTSQPEDRIGVALADGGARVGAISTRVTYSCAGGKSVRLPLRALPARSQAAVGADRVFSIKVRSGSAGATITGRVAADGESIAGTLAARRTIAPYGRCRAGHVVWTAIRSTARISSTRARTYRGSGPRGAHVTLTARNTALTRLRLRAAFTCRHGRHRLTANLLGRGAHRSLPASRTFSFTVRHGSTRARLVGALELSAGGAFGTVSVSERTARFGLCRSGPLHWSTRS